MSCKSGYSHNYCNIYCTFYSAVEVVVVRNPISMNPSDYRDLKPYMKGAMAYITAAWNEKQVQSNMVPREFTIGDGLIFGDYTNVPLQSNTRYGYFIRYIIENDANATNVRCYILNLNIKYMIFLFYSLTNIILSLLQLKLVCRSKYIILL